MRLSLSHPRSPNAVYLLLNNLLQQEQPGRQNLGRVSAPPRSSERARETKAFQHNREKVFIPLLPFPRELLEFSSGCSSLSSESWSFVGCLWSESPSTSQLGAGSGVWLHPNLSIGKTQDTKITPTPTSHGGDPNILTPAGPLTWMYWHKGGFTGTGMPLSIWEQL